MIVGGHNQEDAARFPDAGRPFFDTLGQLFSRSLWSTAGRSVRISLPLSRSRVASASAIACEPPRGKGQPTA